MVTPVCQALKVNQELMALLDDPAEPVPLVLLELMVNLANQENLFLDLTVNQVKMVSQACEVLKDPLVHLVLMVRTALTDNQVLKVIWVLLVFQVNKVHEVPEAKMPSVSKAIKVLKVSPVCVENLELLANLALKVSPVLLAKMLKISLVFLALTAHPVPMVRKVLLENEVPTVNEVLPVLMACLVTKVFQVKMLKTANAANEVHKDLRVHEAPTEMTVPEVIQVNKVSEETTVCPVLLVTLVILAEVVTSVPSILTLFPSKVTSVLKVNEVLPVTKVLKVNEVLMV